MKLGFTLSLLLLAGVLFTGCASTIESRITERQEIFDDYPEEVQARLRRGQIRIGDDTDAVWMVYGKPTEIIQRTDANGRTEVWIYKILSYNQPATYRSYRAYYSDSKGRQHGTYVIDDTPEYTWSEVLRIEFTGGRVAAVQMRQ